MPARYPAILILEMAADRPRDIQKLVRLAPPRVGVITAVSPVHTEFFGSIKRVAVEKRRLAEAIPKEGTLILNTDDEIVQTFAEYTDGTVVGYGIVSGANLKAIEIQEHLEIQLSGELGGIHFKTVQDGAAVPVHIRNALGFQHVYAALAAAAAGAGAVRVLPPVPSGAWAGRLEALRLQASDRINVLRAAAAARLPVLDRTGLPGCELPSAYKIMILPDGGVAPCEHLPYIFSGSEKQALAETISSAYGGFGPVEACWARNAGWRGKHPEAETGSVVYLPARAAGGTR